MLYQRGRYRVEVGRDGSITVKPGDWLSKYSAAIHNDFTAFHQFARRGKVGEPVPISNFNLIFAGETLLHLPTYYGDFDPTEIVVRRGPELSNEQKKKVILEVLKRDFGLKGDNLPIMSKVLDIIDGVDTAIGVAEIFALVAEGGVVATAGTVLALASPILFVFDAAIAFINAAEFGLRVVGMRAVAYGTTAWAFGDPMPPFPATLRENVRMVKPAQVPAYQKAWEVARDSAVRELEAEAKKKKVALENYRVLLRAVGNDDRNTLVRLVMKGFESTLRPGSERDALWAGATKYPN